MAIRTLSTELKSALKALPVKAAELYHLPELEVEDEQSQPISIPVHTDSTYPTAKANKAIAMLTSFHVANDSNGKQYSTRLVNRYPGFVQFDLDQCPTSIEQLTDALNRAKMEFMKELDLVTGTSEQQWEIIHSLAPRIMTHQLKRVIRIACDNIKSANLNCKPQCYYKVPDRLRFYWASKMQSPKVIKDNITNKLAKIQSRPPKNVDQKQWQEQIQSQIDTVNNTNRRLLIRRPTRVQPLLKLSYKNAYGVAEKKIRPIELGATTPILIFSKLDITLKELVEYKKSNSPTEVEKYTLLNEQLYLYIE
ncbi:hypothetical protein TUM3792_43200 [Shewanella sp. MBTL60-007]|nr:hypothetical protein TUM3792_43200 [Shewanella sp. MBTL60-007]